MPILSAQLISWKPEQACGLSCDNTHLGREAIADWRLASALFLCYLMLINGKSFDSVFLSWCDTVGDKKVFHFRCQGKNL